MGENTNMWGYVSEVDGRVCEGKKIPTTTFRCVQFVVILN